jgi:hypothetical protein
MARRGSACSFRPAARRLLADLLGLSMTAILLAGCTSHDSGSSDPPSSNEVALRVDTVHGKGLSEVARARLESQVSDVLAHYVDAGFLGNYPRSDFVQSFADFTSGAAEQAVADIDVLTAARFQDASSVRATDLGAKLSFLVVNGQAIGATAWIDFSFAVDDHGTPKTAALDGRLMLNRRGDRWSVFGYQVNRDDSDTLPTEASSS